LKTCLITGANSGIGKSAAKQIAQKGYRVLLVCRSLEKGLATQEELAKETQNQEIKLYQADLSLMRDVHTLSQQVMHDWGTLDVLINNAADFDLSRKEPAFSEEGYEVQFATNTVAPFLLTNLLLPAMQSQADARVINISSKGLTLYPNIKLDTEKLVSPENYSPSKTYYQTKLALLMNSLYLRRQLEGTSVSVHAVRVTNVKVDINRYSNISPVLKGLYKIKSQFSMSPDAMAEAYTALSTEEKRAGFYFDEKLNEVQCNKSAYDVEMQEKLWTRCQEITKLQFTLFQFKH
jgi:NAD(P)-dependent dehydrogenase (short-subunit alcohol dehydrogenase family)